MDPDNTTDIPIDILPKLPVKSFLRFKTVSKSFNSQISSQTFIRLHKSLSGDKRVLIESVTIETLYSYDLNSISHLLSHPSSTFRWTKEFIQLFNSCSGVLLVHVYTINTKSHLRLLNPSNRTYTDIDGPKSLLPKKYGERFMGLGFDDHTNDYKVLFVSQECTDLFHSYHHLPLIYSVNSESWKIVDRTTRPHSICRDSDDGIVVIKTNLIHWMMCKFGSDNTLRPSRIACFDVCTETWKDDVLLPSHFCDPTSPTRFGRFGVLDDCLFFTFHNKVDSSTVIWVMKEFGVQESWTKLVTVPYSINMRGCVFPVAYRGGGLSEVLLRQCGQSKQVWYNLKDNTMKEARVHKFGNYQPFICCESLVSLPSAKLFESDEIAY